MEHATVVPLHRLPPLPGGMVGGYLLIRSWRSRRGLWR